MNNVMIDLETLGKKPNAPIAAIGAVFFDPENYGLGEEFYTRVDFENHMEKGAVADGDTIKWWLRQPSEARAELVGDDAVSMRDALGGFSDWLTDNADDLGSLKVWAKSPSFDCVILRTAFGLSFDDVPWKYWNERDVRAIEALGLAKGVGTQMFDGVKHHALDDAINQAGLVTYVWSNLHHEGERPQKIGGCDWIDWNELSARGLLKTINQEFFHRLGLAVFYDPAKGVSAGALISDDGKWRYDKNLYKPLSDLVFSEVADFFAGLEPSSPAAMQTALIERLAQVINERAPK
ncbi:3'-5' exoribonuclease [Brenneria nigrifluens]|uniref:3'-5' exoribonuclease n=1 Tax=Brenneria nigrifluens DSM 30175 = ATCC 13028 TaxID=1121120 RepID=A0A2U1UQC9_9GAMM|nr:hypothetical protein BrE312_4304 [Brenneria sp. EniD312]PWC23880.1 3'-5' exoribonuclease [Brenneria nigrifluens] [Brenneria nigrifluens DSM 30175 = ATCC 13028]QCR06551.1 3'-5' exoribonuclease [Brenneria nigrifluens] [Brenneria nigrifluens DSM 30175 = ATCC 13028]